MLKIADKKPNERLSSYVCALGCSLATQVALMVWRRKHLIIGTESIFFSNQGTAQREKSNNGFLLLHCVVCGVFLHLLHSKDSGL